MVGRPGDDRVDITEAEPEDVEIVDGVLNEAAPSGLGGVGPPLRRVGALNREVLVVPKHRRHRCTERAALHEVTELPEDRRAAQHQSALAGDAGGTDRLDEPGGAGEVHVERFLAEHGTAGSQGLVHRSPVRRRRRADPDRIAASGHIGRVGHDVTTEGIGKAAGPPFTLVVDGHDLGLDDATVNEGLDAQAMGPRNETGPDEADAQHAWTLGGGPSRSQFLGRCALPPRSGYPAAGWATTRPASASMKRDATMTSSATSWRSRRLMEAGRPPQMV